MTTPGNSLNIKEVGFQSFDGVSVFKGRTLTAGTGISISNGTGVSGDPVFTASGSVPLSFNGNSGTATPALNILNVVTANSTPKFVGSGSTLTQDFNLSNLVLGSSLPALTTGIQNVGMGSGIFGSLNSGQANVAIGFSSLNAIVGGLRNTAVGAGALQKVVGDVDNTAVGFQALTNCISANNNTAVGSFCLSACTSPSNVGVGQATLGSLTSNGNCTAVGFSALSTATGGENTALGFSVMASLTSGTQNLGLGTSVASNLLTGTRGIFIGYGAGQSYTGAESSDIVIGNNGTIGESNTIRIGTQGAGAGQQNQCFIAGIAGVTNSNVAYTSINTSTGQLGQASANQTQPTRSAFLAYNSVDDTNATGNGAVFTVIFDTEVFDQANNFDGTSTFTAPVTGKYQLSASVRFEVLTAAMTLAQIDIVTSNRTYRSGVINIGAVRTAGNEACVANNVLADMDAGDTAIIQVSITGGAGNTATVSGSAGTLTSYFSGNLVC